MIPVGYMAKKIVKNPMEPSWFDNQKVQDVYSVSSCMSVYFYADYINFWKHNGYWFYNSPQDIFELAREHKIVISDCKMFYYEAYENQYNDFEKSWATFSPEKSFVTNIISPEEKILEGFDIVCFTGETDAGCSPLSCNGMASEIEVNEHCLLSSFDYAKGLVEQEKFKNCEPGPYRIFAVYSIPEGVK